MSTSYCISSHKNRLRIVPDCLMNFYRHLEIRGQIEISVHRYERTKTNIRENENTSVTKTTVDSLDYQ